MIQSCEKFLATKNSNKYAVPDKLQDLQALLDDESTMNTRRTAGISQILSDDGFLSPDRYQLVLEENRDLYLWKPFRSKHPNDWSLAYLPIYNANFCLDMIEDIPMTEHNKDSWRQVKGSAYFFRAYYHLNLLWAYCKAFDSETSERDRGIVLRLTSDFNEANRLSSVMEGYQQVILDALESARYLPDYSVNANRPSRAAAHALLARTYLSMRQYEEARAHAEQALALHPQLMDFSKPGDGINLNQTNRFTRFTKETIFYSSMSSSLGINSPASSFVDTTLFDSYEVEDLRKKAFFFKVGNYNRFYGSYSEAIGVLFSGLTSSEMYLIRAECRVRNGDVKGGMDDMRHLLLHRNVTVDENEITAIEALNFVLEERRKELVWRGIRWSDIKRLNKEGRNIVLRRKLLDHDVTLLPNSDQYEIALPEDLKEYIIK